MPCLTLLLEAGDVAHVWQRPVHRSQSSRVELRVDGEDASALIGPPSDDFTRTQFVAESAGARLLTWDESATLVSLIYAFSPARVFDEGLKALFTQARNRANKARHRLHLSPPFGWMNDPNGLIELGGRTHVFYQHYPHAHRWNTMHWGHAVSANLVDWVDLPVFLLPRPELLADDGKRGGAFSGSAIAADARGLRIFYTDRQDRREPEWEVQMTALSADGLGVENAAPVVERRPPLPGFGRDLRDPYVFRGGDGRWKMLLGGADAEAALVLLYDSADAKAAADWRFVGVLYREPLALPVPAECPSMIALEGEGEGLFALAFGLIGHRDPLTRRRNLSYVVIGRFDGRRFEEVAKRVLDFGPDCYAFQAFRHRSGPLGIAWAANWADVRKDSDYFSAMTFPRRLVWRDGALHMPPVDAVHALRKETFADGFKAFASGVSLPDGLAEVELEFSPGAEFRLDLGHSERPLRLVSDGRVLELVYEPRPAAEAPRYRAEDARLSRLTVFVDVGLVEIFVDDGRLCATKRIDSDAPVASLALRARAEDVVSARAWALRARRGA